MSRLAEWSTGGNYMKGGGATESTEGTDASDATSKPAHKQ